MTNKNLLSRVFGVYDIRGVYGQDLDEAFAIQLGRVYGNYVSAGRAGKFLVGHDARPWSPILAGGLTEGLRQSGHDVVHIALSSTPMTEWYGAELGVDGIAVITASHLPHEYTGFKLSRKDAVPISSEDGLAEIADRFEKNSPPVCAVPGRLINEQPLQKYARHLASHLNPERRLRIALDAGNGAVGPEIPAVFSPDSNVEVIGLALETGVAFPDRSSNPLEAGGLDRLSKTVVESCCDFGVAFDGDADRLVVVDETGKMVAPDVVLGILAGQILRHKPGATILFDLRSTRAVKDVIESAGGKALRTRVGNTYIKAAMRELNAAFAGELSGHYYYDDLHYTDNSVRSLIELINIVAAQDKPLSSLAEPFMNYSISGEMNLKVSDIPSLLKTLEQTYADGDVDLLDGVSVNFPDWWFNARPSKTEPLLRVTVGATHSDILDSNVERLLNLIESSNGH